MADNIRMFKDLLKETEFEVCDISYLTSKLNSMGFFHAPASTKYHGAYVGGLFDHSYEVTKSLMRMTDKLGLKWSRKESPVIVGMFHDLCKCDAYIIDPDGKIFHSETSLYTGHGEKSVMLLSSIMKLTEEEVACIRYHMGPYIKEDWDNYGRAVEIFPNVLFTHTADMDAARVRGV